MLDKLAQLAAVRESEVRGCLAAFHDAGILKTASAEDFDTLSHAVASNIGIDYDIDTIYKTAAFLLNGAQEQVEATVPASSHDQEKTASSKSDSMAAIGALFMQKVAGKIDEATFARVIGPLMKQAEEEVGKEEKCDCGKEDCPICSKKDPEDKGKVDGATCN